MVAGKRTLFRAGWVVAHDGRGQRLLRDGVVVVEDGAILHVGATFAGRVDEEIDARDRVITPGFISTHAHIYESPLDRSFIEDTGNPRFYNSGLFEMLPVRGAAQDADGTRACVEFSVCELLRGGCTTVMEMGGAGEIVSELAGRYGIRAYIGQSYRSARWFTRNGHAVEYSWDEESGRRNFQRALDFIAQHSGSHGDRVRGFLNPSQVDTCTGELLRESYRLAEELHVPMQVHTSQSVNEFQEMLRRHGTTPIAWLASVGALGPRTILGHAIIVGGSSWANYPPGDMALMADSGCTVAHAPWVFARRGIPLESFHRYQEAGIALSLGNRYLPAEHDRGDALGGGRREDRRAAHAGDERGRCLRRRDARRRARAGPRRSGPHRVRRARRSALLARRWLGHDAAARPDPQHRLQRAGGGYRRSLCGRATGLPRRTSARRG